MTDINFLYWLRGFLEDKTKATLSVSDVHTIKQHLALVTSKEMQATVFIEGILMGLEMTLDSIVSYELTTLLSNIVGGVIQEVAGDKKDELVKEAKIYRAAGRGLSGGFCDGISGLKIC